MQRKALFREWSQSWNRDCVHTLVSIWVQDDSKTGWIGFKISTSKMQPMIVGDWLQTAETTLKNCTGTWIDLSMEHMQSQRNCICSKTTLWTLRQLDACAQDPHPRILEWACLFECRDAHVIHDQQTLGLRIKHRQQNSSVCLAFFWWEAAFQCGFRKQRQFDCQFRWEIVLQVERNGFWMLHDGTCPRKHHHKHHKNLVSEKTRRTAKQCNVFELVFFRFCWTTCPGHDFET